MSMKKLIATMLLFMAFSVQAQSFKHSQEEELEEFAIYLFNNRNYDRWTNLEEAREAVDHIALMKLSDLHSIEWLLERVKANQIVRQRVINFDETFKLLKQKMNIPAEVQLHFKSGDEIEYREGSNIEAYYDPFRRLIWITADTLTQTPSRDIYILIHELTHAQQHHNLGLVNYSNQSKYEMEHQAEIQAMQSIKCPICMQLVIDQWNDSSDNDEVFSKLHQDGYLSLSDVKIYKNHKNIQDVCNAHAAETEQALKLRSLMSEQSRGWFGWLQNKDKSMERRELDERILASSEDRLSTVRFEK